MWIFYVLIIEFQKKKKKRLLQKQYLLEFFLVCFINTGTIQVKEESIKVFLLTNVISMDLRSKWEKQKWDIEELNYICLALDNNCEDFNPTFFTD